jgi:acetylornithine deacetylase/succinyl-diaminopimelate desuccinylase-like protein
MYNILKGKNTGLRNDEIGFAQKLIQTPSTSLEESAIADVVEHEMKKIGYDRVFRDESGNVVGILFGRESAPTVLLNSHMDTVSPEGPESWSFPPYAGQIDGDVLYGEGAADCKGGLAAQVYTGALLKRSLLPLRGNLVVAATVAEENGASVGVRGLLDKTLPNMGLKPDYAILGEPTGLGLYYGHDGWVEVDIHIESYNPALLKDAERTIVRDCEVLAGSSGGRQIERLEPVPVGAESSSQRDLRLMHRVAEGVNVGTAVEQIEHEVQLAAHPNPSVNVAVRVHEEPQRLQNGRMRTVRRISNAWSTDPFSRLIERARQSLAAAGCDVRPGKWTLGRLGMGTAGGVLVNDFGIPTIGYGPGNEEKAHAVDESVRCSDLAQTVYGTASMVHALIGVPVCGWTADEI